jgi:hypothetical protein
MLTSGRALSPLAIISCLEKHDSAAPPVGSERTKTSNDTKAKLASSTSDEDNSVQDEVYSGPKQNAFLDFDALVNMLRK